MHRTSPTEHPAPDPQAWLAEHGDALYRYALLRLRDTGAAEDMVQETLLSAWQNRDSFGGHSSPRTWLIGILKHKIADHLRRRMREAPHPDIPEDDILEQLFEDDGSAHWRRAPSPWDNPQEALGQRQFWAAFLACLDGLPERQANAFSLCELDGLSGDEACKVLGLSTTNLWVLLHRARLRLRECLENNWFVR